MDIGTIISGLNALGGLFGANQSPQLTPAMAEGEKSKKAQQSPVNTFVILPNQTPPMGVGVPPAPPPSYWSDLPPANVLRNPIWRMPQTPFGMPMFRGVPPTTDFPNFGGVSLRDLYELYFGTRL